MSFRGLTFQRSLKAFSTEREPKQPAQQEPTVPATAYDRLFALNEANAARIIELEAALAKPAQPKYRRGNRLICLETEEYCVIHISGTDRQWVKFPDSHIGVYTNEQVAELFELLPKEPEQESVAIADYMAIVEKYAFLKASQRTWVGLTDAEKSNLWIESRAAIPRFHTYATLVEAKLKQKNMEHT